MPAKKRPAGHLVGTTVRVDSQYPPAEHISHADDALEPVLELKLPAAHPTVVTMPTVGQKAPAVQFAGDDMPAVGQKVPAGALWHADGKLAPLPGLKVPAAQL